MNRCLAINNVQDIPGAYQKTPISLLLEYHNLGRAYDAYTQAQILIGMCMDSRKHLKIPDNFAYIIRSGGANLRYSEFKVAYAIAVGEVRAIALITHTQCGMVNLAARKDLFIQGLTERAGWSKTQAEDIFCSLAALFEIGNEVDFALEETARLRHKYPKIPVAPMIYQMEDNRLYLLKEDRLTR